MMLVANSTKAVTFDGATSNVFCTESNAFDQSCPDVFAGRISFANASQLARSDASGGKGSGDQPLNFDVGGNVAADFFPSTSLLTFFLLTQSGATEPILMDVVP